VDSIRSDLWLKKEENKLTSLLAGNLPGYVLFHPLLLGNLLLGYLLLSSKLLSLHFRLFHTRDHTTHELEIIKTFVVRNKIK
jgi:hypothetical protein